MTSLSTCHPHAHASFAQSFHISRFQVVDNPLAFLAIISYTSSMNAAVCTPLPSYFILVFLSFVFNYGGSFYVLIIRLRDLSA